MLFDSTGRQIVVGPGASGTVPSQIFAQDKDTAAILPVLLLEASALFTIVESMAAKKKTYVTGPAVGTAQEVSLPLGFRLYKVEVDPMVQAAGQFVLAIEKLLAPVAGDAMVAGGLIAPYANAVGAPGTQSVQRDWSTSGGFDGFVGGIGIWLVVSSTTPLYTPTVTARASWRIWWTDVS